MVCFMPKIIFWPIVGADLLENAWPKSTGTWAGFSLLLLQGLCVRVYSEAVLRLHMDRYDNSYELDYDGDCCDFRCWGACDHKFIFCLDTQVG